jgi:hypothetical protein
LLGLSHGFGGLHVQGLAVTGQQHAGIDGGQHVSGSRRLFPIVAENAWHQPGAGSIREGVSVDEGIVGDEDSVIREIK